MFFEICECCGAHLDPNESCDCQESEFYFEKEKKNNDSKS